MKPNFELKQLDRMVLSVKWLAMECFDWSTVPGRGRDLAVHRCLQTSSGDVLVSFPMGSGALARG